MLGGVAAGLAEHFAIDVAIVRVVLVVLALLTNGVAAVAYVIALLVIPETDEPSMAGGAGVARGSSPAASAGANPTGSAATSQRDATFWIGTGLLVIAGIVLVSGPLAPHRLLGDIFRGDVVVAIVLIAFGFALWRVGDRRDSAAATDSSMSAARVAAPPSFAPTETTMPTSSQRPPDETAPIGALRGDRLSDDDAYDASVASVAADGGAGATPPADAAGGGRDWSFTPPPVEPRERSVLGRATAGLALMAVGVVWLLDSIGMITASGVQLLATALLVVGLGLVIGAFAGRARGLIVVGILLVPLVLVAALLRPYSAVTFADGLVRDGAGDVTEAPATVADVRQEYALAAGRLIIDLSTLDLSSADVEPVEIVAEMGAGELAVLLPDDVTVTINARLGVGELRILDRSHGWLGAQRTTTIAVGDGTYAIDLDVRLGVGQLTIAAPSGATTTETTR